jgi:hypothetical protein
MPFLLLVCGLLGGALVSALFISTMLEQGSFQITKLQQRDSQLAQHRQLLADQVAADRSLQGIYDRAYGLGMRTQGVVRFLDLKNGKIETDTGNAGSGYGAVNMIDVPGYTP